MNWIRYLLISSLLLCCYLIFRLQIIDAVFCWKLSQFLRSDDLANGGVLIFSAEFLVLVLVFLIYLPKVFKEERRDSTWVTILVMGVVVYSIERYLNDPLEFYPRSSPIKILDLLYVVAYFDLVTLGINLIPRAKKYSRSAFELERPKSSKEEDLLDRRQFAESIANQINLSYFPEAFSIGVVGEWSSGKSTFLNFILNSLEPSERIIVRFKPWLNYDSNGIVRSFFSTLKKELGEYDSRLTGVIEQYASLLVNLDGGFISKLLNTWSIRDRRTLEQEFDEINKHLRILGKQIVVVIDDLDRLDAPEIIEVFKLIRNTANFHNTVYLTAFDRSYVASAISQINNFRPSSYIDKIFDLEYALPQVSASSLIHELNHFLTSTLGVKTIDEFSSTAKIIQRILKNRRDLVRCKHALLINWTHAAAELLFDDFLVLEILRFKYPQIVSFFYSEYKVFLDWLEMMRMDHNYTLRENEDGISDFRKRLEEREQDQFAKFRLTGTDMDVLDEAFKFLFKDRKDSFFGSPSNNEIGFNSIRRTKYFEIYFSLIFGSDSLRINEFETTLGNFPTSFENYVLKTLLSEPIGTKPIQVFELLRRRLSSYVNSATKQQNIAAMLLLFEARGIGVDPELFMTLFHKNSYSSLDEVRLSFFRLFNNGRIPAIGRGTMLRGIISKQIRGGESGLFPFRKDELICLNEEIFASFLKESSEFSDELMSLYYRNYVDIDQGTNIVSINPKVSEMLGGFLKRDVRIYSDYFNWLICPKGTGVFSEQYVFAPFWQNLFDGADRFRQFLDESQYEHKEILLRFFDRYKENKFESFEIQDEEWKDVPPAFINIPESHRVGKGDGGSDDEGHVD